ncbi:DUF2304 domain-containing protein [Collinsella sp. An2]|uniref:DUF2304 domain-containing protein n=1 Tax=Collinsella sp. An2 TaxID=1965585 RepID=UPI000B3810E7|nr:DUF2304 domain-containing protein [Collinsella sp. An2]OUP10058.1 hypothetical protein B5F33_03095 [Collinsella sp. An2]
MSLTLRVFLLICAIIVLMFVVRKTKKSQITSGDSIFWLIMSLGFVVLSIFPQIAFSCATFLGIQSPSNFVFLVIIALLLIREFSIQSELSALRTKLTALVQEIAIRNTLDNDLPCTDSPTSANESSKSM